MPDEIDAAINAPKKPDSLVAEARVPGKGGIRLIVPRVFDADLFETCVGLLMQLRVASDQEREAEERGGIVVPDRKLVLPQ